MELDEYLEYEKDSYGIFLFEKILEALNNLYLYKREFTNKVEDNLIFLREKSLQYDRVLDSMIISKIFSSDNNFKGNRDEIYLIDSSLKYFEMELEDIRDSMDRFEKLIGEKKESIGSFERDEKYLVLSGEYINIYLYTLILGQIEREEEIILNIKEELQKMNSFGTYDKSKVLRFIKLDSNNLITNILIKEAMARSKLKIDQEIRDRISIFDKLFSEYILNNKMKDSIDTIDMVLENLKLIHLHVEDRLDYKKDKFIELKEGFYD